MALAAGALAAAPQPTLHLHRPARHVNSSRRLPAQPVTTPRPKRQRAAAAPCALLARGKAACWWRQPKPDTMAEVHSVQQLVNELHEHKDRLVVVEFYAPWCSGCKALLPRLIALAEADPSVRWLTVDYDENKPLGRGLGVTALPTILMFRGEQGQVEAFQATAAKIQLLTDALARHGGPRPPAASVPPLAAFPHVRPRALQQQQQQGLQPLAVVSLSAPPEPPPAQPPPQQQQAAALPGSASNVVEMTGHVVKEPTAPATVTNTA